MFFVFLSKSFLILLKMFIVFFGFLGFVGFIRFKGCNVFLKMVF